MAFLREMFSPDNLQRNLDLAAKNNVVRRLRDDEVTTAVIPLQDAWAWVDEGIDNIVLIGSGARYIVPMDDVLEAEGRPITLREYKY